MAIAYYIPDQNKLLARTSANTTTTNSTSNSSTTQQQQQSNQQQPSATNATTAPSINHQQQHQQQQQSQNNSFRANITIPITPFGATQHTVGCWDLLTQVFCYALRFYHESNRNPAVIQISFEISSGGGISATSTPPTTPTATQPQPTVTSRTPRTPASSTETDERCYSKAAKTPKRN